MSMEMPADSDVLPGERMTWSAVPDLPGVMRLEARTARIFHMFHETYVVSSWDPRLPQWAEWAYRGRSSRSEILGNQVFEPGETHRVLRRAAGLLEFRALLIEPRAMDTAVRELGYRKDDARFRTSAPTDPVVARAFLRLHAAVGARASALERQTRWTSALRLLLERCGESPMPSQPAHRDPRGAHRARDFLLSHLGENVSLDELSRESGLSRFHLVRAFAARFGAPPHRFQILARLERSRTMLALGERAIDVAADLGFADQAHFGRRFKAAYGASPSSYARSVRTSAARTAIAF